MRPIWLDEISHTVKVIDQRQLPHSLVIVELATVDKVITAIQAMYRPGSAPHRCHRGIRCVCGCLEHNGVFRR